MIRIYTGGQSINQLDYNPINQNRESVSPRYTFPILSLQK